MYVLRLIIAAGSFTLISGAPVPSFPSLFQLRSNVAHTLSSIEERDTANAYTTYGGDGTVADGWPAMSDWTDFDTMFSNNQAVMQASCTQFGVADNSDDEIANIKSAVSSVASSTGVDARFILAIVLQESNGCVRAPTTNYGVRNPGLMQSHDGAGTCNDASVQNPCPASEITQMITDGVAGTSSGDGLKQCIAETGATDVSMYYQAARIYNSGSIASVGGIKNLGAGIATHCYSSDIANRLTGWFSGPSSCNPNTIASFVGTATSSGSSSSGSSSGSSGSAPVASPSTTPGGVFAATSASATKPTSTSAAVAPVVTSAAPVVSSAPVVSAPPASSPSAVTVSVIPTPAAASTPAAAAPTGVSGSSSSSGAKASSSSSSTTSGLVTPGTACGTEGLWNCVDGSSFQQCASGMWSEVESLAAGMQCTVGQSAVFGVSAIAA